MTYRSVLYCTSNEYFQEQIEIEKSGGWLQRLRNMIKQRKWNVDNYSKETWVCNNGAWTNKITREYPNFDKMLELHVIKLEFIHLS